MDKQCKDRKSIESRNNEISERNERHEKSFGTRDELFITESKNVSDKKIVDSKASNLTESVVDKLRYIKQQTSKRTRYTRLSDLNDAKISTNAFFESARVLDSVCNSPPTTRRVHKATGSLGLVPFVVLERCDANKQKSPIHSGSAARWSLEEDNEEDIFADVKDDAENTVEFSQWEYDLPKSPENLFHGFSPREIQCSRNENDRYKQWVSSQDTMEIKGGNILPLLGFSAAEITSSRRISEDWRCKTEKYFCQDTFSRAHIQQAPLSATKISSDYFDPNETVVDNTRSPYKKAQGLLSKDTEYTNNEREKGMCKFTTARGSVMKVSEAALKKAETIYSEEALSIKEEACSNNNLKNSVKSEYPLKFPTYPPSSAGFSTAGGRSISISKAALKKAEIIYSEEASSIKNDSRENSKLKDLPKSEYVSKSVKSNLCGFSTASGRSISISETALKKAETIYSEEVSTIKEDSCVKSNLKVLPELEKSLEPVKCESRPCGFSTAGGRSIRISQEALKKAETLYSEEASIIDEKVFDDNYLNLPKSENLSKPATNAASSSGFSTAGGCSIIISTTGACSIMISTAAVKKAETLYSQEPSSIEENVCNYGNLKDLPKSENVSKQATNAASSSGFSTAGGRSIIISKPALKKAETLYSEEASSIEEKVFDDSYSKDLPKSENLSKPATNPASSSGFSTARGRSIVISKTALKKAETLYSEEASSIEEKIFDDGYSKDLPKSENLSKPATNAASSSGFSTAGGRSIVISKTALKKAETLYSEEASSIEEKVFDDGCLKDLPKSENLSKQPTNAASSSGFSTAGGRSIIISKTALKKAETLYSEEASSIKEESCDNRNVKNLSDFEKASKLATCVPSTLGFSTAGGRSITVSKAALKKAETIYSEEASSIKENDCLYSNLKDLRKSENSSNRTTLSTSTGFTTTGPSRKRVHSEVQNCEASSSSSKTPKYGKEDTIHRRNANVGFATARGQKLKISETALSKAKALLDEDEPVGDLEFVSKNIVSTAKSNASEPKSSTVENVQLPADLDNFESLDFDDFADPIEDDELSKKRKINNDDEETPLRGDVNWKHKRGRYANELQGKKLFFEDSNFDDDAPAEKNTRIVPTTKLPEDKKHLKGLNVQEKENPPFVKTKPENIPLRKPISPKLISKAIQKTTGFSPGASTSSNRAIGLGRNSLDDQPEAIPDDLEFDTQFSDDEFCPLLGDFILRTMKIMEARLAMTRKQDEIIRGKRRTKPQHCDGYLYKLRSENSDKRISWQELTEGAAPQLRQISNEALENDVCFVTSKSAESYSFCCTDLFGSKNAGVNAEGLKVGDDAFLILDEKNRAGVCEFERAFLTSPGVDPNLVPPGWVKNHYRWIVWKLASIDRVDFGHKYLPRMLTPDRVMYELRYRYDREIYRTQWPPLKRILEKNEDPAARIVLCVASITVMEGNQNAPKGSNTPNALSGPLYKMKLTDGWYCIDACIDTAMNNCIKNGKVKEGTKLMTVGAKAMNLNQGCSVLEIPGDVSLRIHTNSTRRVKWNTKLDYYRNNPGPMLLSLKSIKPNGGMICKLIVAVARLYPVLYREKLPDGQFVFRNARCDEEAALAYEERHQAKMEEIYASARAEFQANLGNLRANERTKNRICMEQSFREREDELRQLITSKLRECLPPPRDVTPVMKIRIAEGDTSAMMTVWSSDTDTNDIFVEGSSVAIYNSFASRLRLNELQVTVGRSSFMKRETTRRIVYPERIFTSLIDIAEPGFNPVYGEFDTIGIVSSVGPAPHGMKNFDTVNLACPTGSEDNTSSFLSVLFWQGVSTHGCSKILTVGSLVACSNLEWRKNTTKSIPTAYCTERSVFSKNPRQNHLTEPFETLRRQIKEPFAYAAMCATMIEEEIARKASLRTPCKGTPCRLATSNSSTPVWTPRDSRNSTSANSTPGIDSRKSSTMKRLEKLETYGEPPKLPPIVINNSSRKVLSDFRSPVVTPVTKS